MSMVMTMVILMMLTMISVHWDQTTDRSPFTPVFLFPAVPMILANTSPLPLITFYITFLSLFSSSFFLSLFHFFSVSYSLFSVSFIFLFCLLYDHFFFCFFDTLILIVLPPTMSKILAKSSDAFLLPIWSKFDLRMILVLFILTAVGRVDCRCESFC